MKNTAADRHFGFAARFTGILTAIETPARAFRMRSTAAVGLRPTDHSRHLNPAGATEPPRYAFRLTPPTRSETRVSLDDHVLPQSHPSVRSAPSLRPTSRVRRWRAERRSRIHLATATAARSALDGREHDGRLERVGGRMLPYFRFPSPIQPAGTGMGRPAISVQNRSSSCPSLHTRRQPN